MNIEDVIDLKLLQEIQDNFAFATGFACIAVDYKGNPVLEYSNFSNFCQLLRRDPICNDKCRQCDAHGGLESARKEAAYFYKCHTGLIDFAVPIIYKGEYLGAMMCGQILCDDDHGLSNILNEKQTVFTDESVLAEYEKIPVMPLSRIKASGRILNRMLNSFVDRHSLIRENAALKANFKESTGWEKQMDVLELRHLKSQINNHFLFNVLNSIGRLAMVEGAEKTQEITYTLADMYKYLLRENSFVVSLEEEMKHVSNYLYIQSVRFGELFRYVADIPSELGKYQVPSLLIQIFVENAVGHGLEKKEKMGNLSIKAYRNNSILYITITDDGIGIPDYVLAHIKNENYKALKQQEYTGLGIYNAKKRIKLFHPQADITIESEAGKGTCVTIKIPVGKA